MPERRARNRAASSYIPFPLSISAAQWAACAARTASCATGSHPSAGGHRTGSAQPLRSFLLRSLMRGGAIIEFCSISACSVPPVAHGRMAGSRSELHGFPFSLCRVHSCRTAPAFNGFFQRGSQAIPISSSTASSHIVEACAGGPDSSSTSLLIMKRIECTSSSGMPSRFNMRR